MTEESPRGTLVLRATDLLRDGILDGRFPQGSRLKEAHLATEFGLSRGPIREALRSLEREGLVLSLQNRGSFVSRVRVDNVAEILSLREVLEPEAARRSLTRRSSPAGAILAASRAMRESVEVGNFVDLARLHAEFHSVVYQETPGRLLADIWNRIELPLRMHVGSRTWTERAADAFVYSHELLAQELIPYAAVTTSAAIRQHLAEAWAQLPFPFSRGSEPAQVARPSTERAEWC